MEKSNKRLLTRIQDLWERLRQSNIKIVKTAKGKEEEKGRLHHYIKVTGDELFSKAHYSVSDAP